MLAVFFLFIRQFSLIELLVFKNNFVYPFENVNFLSSKLKRNFTAYYLCADLGLENCQIGHVFD